MNLHSATLPTLLVALVSLSPAPAAQTQSTIVSFGSSPPPWYWTSGSLPSIINVHQSLGDLDGDGVTDFVFSNQLGYLAVYLFPTNSYQATPTHLLIRDPGLGPTNNCTATTPADWRRRTLGTYQDDVLIYDIDLDGKAEIICTDLATSGASSTSAQVGLCIYDVDRDPVTSALVWSQKPLTNNYVSFHGINNPPTFNANVAPIQKTFSPTGGQLYFQCGDKAGVSVHLAIGNVRGRSSAQDILVWTAGADRDFAHSVYGYSNGSGSTSNSLDVLMYVDPQYNSNIPNSGEPGHTRMLADVNGDGRDEVFGRHLFEYVEGLMPAPGSPDVKNGRYLWSVEHLIGTDKHIDSVVAGDILRSFQEESTGRTVASPGVELAMTAQHPVEVTGSGSNTIDGGGAWIYRGITGHDAPRWPRMIIGHSPNYDYETPYNAVAYNEPSPSSNWDSLGTAFTRRLGSPHVGDLDPQDIWLGNFLASEPGPELLVTYKSTPRVTPPGWSFPNLLWRHGASLIGTDAALTVHNWWFNFGMVQTSAPYAQDTQRNGVTGPYSKLIDFHGTREQIECSTDLRGLLRGLGGFNSDPPQNHRDPFHKMIFGFAGGLTNVNPEYYSLYPTNSNQNGSETWYAEPLAADMLGDSREEYVIIHNPSAAPVYARIVTSTDAAGAAARVGQPSPETFLGYQASRRANTVDYEAFDGLSLHATSLPKGTLGQPYGQELDRSLWSTATTPAVGVALIPEGGVSPYTISLVEGKLPANILAVPGQVRDYQAPGNPVVAKYDSVLLLQGTPSESGFRRLRFLVTDSNGDTASQVLHMHIEDPNGNPATDPRPKIVAGGFDGAFLLGGIPQNVVFRAFVSDPQNDATGVGILDPFGNPLGFTALDNGNAANADLVAGDGIFSALVPAPSLPAGLGLNLQMVAFDAQNNLGPTWPFINIEGGPRGELPPFELDPAPPTQTAAQTPTIDFVFMPPVDLPPAERTDASGSQPIWAVIKSVPAGTTITSVVARVNHHVPGVDSIDVNLVQSAPGSLVWAGALTTPSGEFGYGRYSINVRATATVTGSSTEFLSDWWPSLQWH